FRSVAMNYFCSLILRLSAAESSHGKQRQLITHFGRMMVAFNIFFPLFHLLMKLILQNRWRNLVNIHFLPHIPLICSSTMVVMICIANYWSARTWCPTCEGV